MALLLSTVKTQYGLFKKDISDVGSADFLQWTNFIGEQVYDAVKGTDPERFVDTSNTYTVSADPQTTALPSDFGDISSWDMGFFSVNSSTSKVSDRRLVRTGPGDGRPGFYVTGNTNVIFTGINDSSQYNLRYLPTRTDATDVTEYFTLDGTSSGAPLIPDGKLQYLLKALDVLYTQWDEVPQDEILADQRFMRQLDQLILNVRREPDAYGLSDYSSTF